MPLSSCPECEMPMKVTTYDDVLIDVCPSCRGVWLDRGELQKIIAYVRAEESGEIGEDFAKQPPRTRREEKDERRDRDERHRDERGRDEKYRKDEYGKEKRRKDKYRDDDDDRYERKRKKKKKGAWGLWDVLEDLID